MADSKFGSCCEILKDVLPKRRVRAADRRGGDWYPLHVDRSDGHEEDDEPNMVDHPVFFCPFCGNRACRRLKRSTPRPATPTGNLGLPGI